MDTFIKKLTDKNFWAICIIFALGLAVYSFVLQAPFKTMDDQFSIVQNDQIKDIKNAGALFLSSYFGDQAYYRPLVSLSYMLEYHFFGLNPFYYYLVNILLHTGCAICVFLLLNRLNVNRAVSFFSACFFAIHPIHWEAVANIPGRSILLSSFFSLHAFLFFLRSKSGRKSAWHCVLSLLLFMLSLFAKESAAMLPIILVLFIVLGLDETKPSIKSVIPYFIIVLAYVIFRRGLGLTQVFFWPSFTENILGVITFLRGLLTYLTLFLFPVNLHFDRSLKLWTTFSNPEVWITLSIYLFMIVLLIKNWRSISPLVHFFILYFFVEFFPVSQVVASVGAQPGFISLAEHFLYLPSIAVFVLVGMLAHRQYQFAKTKLWAQMIYKSALIVLFVLLFNITVLQSIHARDESMMFLRTLKYNPENVRIRYSLAMNLVDKGLFEQAEGHLRKVLEDKPDHFRAWISLGSVLCDQGRYREGLDVYLSIPEVGKYQELIRSNIKNAQAKMLQTQTP